MTALVTHPLVEADNRPQAAAHCTATAQAATEKPLHIHWQVLLQARVHPADTGLKLLWCYLREQNRTERVKTELFNLKTNG